MNKISGPAPAFPLPNTAEGTLRCAPVSPSARQLTVTVDTLGFNVRVKTGFALDLGNNPQVGDAWSPDAWLDLGGFPCMCAACSSGAVMSAPVTG